MEAYKIWVLLAVLVASLISVVPNVASAAWCSTINVSLGCPTLGWQNYTIVSNSTNQLANVMNTITVNFGWFWTIALAFIYASLFLLYAREPTRNKFIGMAFGGLMISTVFRMYGLISSVTWLSAWAVMIFVFIIIRLT